MFFPSARLSLGKVAMRHRYSRSCQRDAFSYLEMQVALVLFAFALASLAPLVIVQSRQARHLQEMLATDTTHYFVPSDDRWARKLGAGAELETVEPPPVSPPVTLIDNGDPGYSEIEQGIIDWTTSASPPALGSAMRWNNGNGSLLDSAVWQFTQVTPGWHRVLVTYDADNDHAKASNAPYRIYDGEVAIATVRVDQTKPPSGSVFAGVPWESLGVFPITQDMLRVELGDDADNDIVADGVRIVRLENDVQLISVDKSFADDICTAEVTVTVQVP
jgi:hypothetical protein